MKSDRSTTKLIINVYSDTFDIEDSVEIEICRRQCSRNHICHW